MYPYKIGGVGLRVVLKKLKYKIAFSYNSVKMILNTKVSDLTHPLVVNMMCEYYIIGKIPYKIERGGMGVKLSCTDTR